MAATIRTCTLDRAFAADTHDLAVLDDAKQSNLGGEGELADLVEKERPAIGLLEPALPAGDRAGEGAGLVAEELGVDQFRRDGAAVHTPERTTPERGVLVDARAMISLPVPVSPKRSTGALLRETMRARAMTAARPVSPPIRRSSPCRALAVDQFIRRQRTRRGDLHAL